MVSIWWVLASFVIGGYAGAVLVALMSMVRDPEPRRLELPRRADVRDMAHARAEPERRRQREGSLRLHS